jgi:hypothetical protein
LLTFREIFVQIHHAVRRHWVGDALDFDVATLFAIDQVLHMGMSLVRDEDLTRSAGGFKPSG